MIEGAAKLVIWACCRTRNPSLSRDMALAKR
jgi:hypothetical protein